MLLGRWCLKYTRYSSHRFVTLVETVTEDKGEIAIEYQLYWKSNVEFKIHKLLNWLLGWAWHHALPFTEYTQWFPTFPHTIKANFGTFKHYFEIGYGVVVMNKEIFKSTGSYIFTPIIGWRYKSTKGFTLRIYASPVIYGKEETNYVIDQYGNLTPSGNHSRLQIYPFVGLSLGSSF